jgi:hypothetical protein
VSTYPVTFEADYVEPRSRLTTFFRGLLAIPHFIVLAFYGLAACCAVVVAWFALLFTERWPMGLYMFTAGYLRYYARVYAYAFLLVDPYPPFSAGEEPSYPVRLNIAAPQEEYNRLKVLLRIFYVIPAAFIVAVLNLVLELVGFVAWLVIVITGKQPKGLQDALALCISYHARVNALFLLVTETYPPFNDDHATQIGEHAAASPLPADSAPAAPEAPSQAPPPASVTAGGFKPPAPPPPAAVETAVEPNPPAEPEPPGEPEPPAPSPPAAAEPGPPAPAEPPAPESTEENEPPPGPFGPSSNA